MATEEIAGYGDISLIAGADLSAANNQYRAVVLNGSRQIVLAGIGVAAIGILQNLPANGDTAVVRCFGVSKMRAGAAVVAPGASPTLLKADATGRLIALQAAPAGPGVTDTTAGADSVTAPLRGSNVIGQGLTAAAALDEIFIGLVMPQGAVPSTVG